MKWCVKKRMEFIESRLLWEGKISRKDLIDFFNISIPQASKDLKLYAEKAPSNIQYNKSGKYYVATKNFKPIFVSPESESYFSQLEAALKDNLENIFPCGYLPPAYKLPNPTRLVEPDILKVILKSIHEGYSIRIRYQSMSTPDPTTRWISPHALGFDGYRWHVRSLCHNHKEYRDFNLGRILEICELKKYSFDHTNDFLWHTNITFKITTHPDLSENQKKCIERDYNMKNGILSIKIKAAFDFYLRRQLGLTQNHDKKPAKEQPLILDNTEEIDAQIKLLKSMEQEKLANITFLS